MITEAKSKITSTELGTLWMTYTSLTARLIILDLFKDKIVDKDAQRILTDYLADGQIVKNAIVNIFNNEKAIIPIGFNEHDIVRKVPPLFDDIFQIMFLRKMMKLNYGYDGVFAGRSYIKEVNDLFKLNFETTNKFYMLTTDYLLEKGDLIKPPYADTPKEIDFVEDKSYISGLNILAHKRILNTIEVGYINEAIEYNTFGLLLFTGFAQVATDNEIKKYFVEGKELAKRNVTKLNDILLQSDVQSQSAGKGNVTNSTQAPFSDKLMMFINSLLSSTSLGFTGLGTTFSMRGDLPLKLGLISKDTFDYAKKGAKIMIKHKWMEEPPQIKDKKQQLAK